MKTGLFKTILALALALIALPMMGQDFMNVYFKDGNHRKYFMPYVKEIFVSKYDKDGSKHSDYEYQHIITSTNKYVYNLVDIDSISYTKCNEVEVEKNIITSLKGIIPILDECSNITDVEKNIDIIKKTTSVEDAWIGGGQLNVKVKGWGIIGFHFHDDGIDENNNEEDAGESNLMKKISSIASKAQTNNIEPLKVAIANQTKNNKKGSDVNLAKRFDKIKSLFESCGINPTPVDPTLEFFSSGMFDYDVIILCTHGSIGADHGAYWKDEEGNYVHFLYTSDFLGAIDHEATDEDRIMAKRNLLTLLNKNGLMDFYSNDLIRFDFIKEYTDYFHGFWVAYPLVRENFIRDASDKVFKNPNSLLFAAVCHSLEASTSLAWKLHETKHLGNYLGFNGEVDMGVASNAALYYFESLLKGNSFRKGEDDIPDDYKIDTSWRKNTKLESQFGENSFLFPTYTKQIDPTVALTAFDTSKSVEVEGLTLTLDHNAISCGFEYGPKYDQSWKRIKSTNIIPLTTITDKGNVLFRAELSDLKPGNTYYYRAYTDDGMNYNYGNIDSLTIYEPMTLSAETVQLNVGESSLIQITSGSGSYFVESIIPQDIVTAEIIGNRIAVNAMKAGTATITVKDNKSGQTAIVEVTVTGGPIPVSYLTCPDDHHPHLIDLGLPSGTLWRCCNEGASAPEEYGDYYTFGQVDSAPTSDQIKELLNSCTSESTTLNGVNGFKFTGPNGGSIFLPAAGVRWDGELGYAGYMGRYWSSTPYSSSLVSNGAYNLYFYSDIVDWDYHCSHANELSVRSVTIGTPTAGKQNITVNGVSFTMIKVEGGTFQMGSTSGGSLEKPVHKVTLTNEYYIGEIEVTQDLWKAVMGSNPSYFTSSNQLPVENVSWNDCQTFISKLNELTGKTFRLPTEAEWEFAARGGNASLGYTYSGSNSIGDVGWYLGNSSSKTHEVAKKAPNELGIYDMSGNVSEWCQDRAGYFTSEDQTNPTGPTSGYTRVVRDGNWHESDYGCRVSSRYGFDPSIGVGNCGLRLAM